MLSYTRTIYGHLNQINKKKVNFTQKSEQMSQRPLIICEHSQSLEHKEKVDTTVVI